MFSIEQGPWVPAGASLRNLHFSMNAPVVAIDELPVGPARAAIALLAGDDVARVALAVRSLRAEQTVFFVSGDALDPRREPSEALEAGFSFAERMGFLFDEDEVESGGEADTESARERWHAFHGVDLLEAEHPEGGAGLDPSPPGNLHVVADAPPLGLNDANVLSKFRLQPGSARLLDPLTAPADAALFAAAEARLEAPSEPELRLLLLSRF